VPDDADQSAAGSPDSVTGSVVFLADVRLLRALSTILRTAVDLQRDAARVIDACLEPGGKTADLARLGGRVTSGYFRLREQLRSMPDHPLVREVDALVNYHQQIVEQAMLFGYRGFDAGREKVLRGWSDRLGAPAQRLRDVYVEVQRRLANREYQDGERSG
jgi:hypothetical protein